MSFEKLIENKLLKESDLQNFSVNKQGRIDYFNLYTNNFKILKIAYDNFKKDIPEKDFPIFDHYDEEKEMQRTMFRKAGRKRLRAVDTIIPAALTLDLKKWL